VIQKRRHGQTLDQLFETLETKTEEPLKFKRHKAPTVLKNTNITQTQLPKFFHQKSDIYIHKDEDKKRKVLSKA
jgi:CRISPR/Cas system CSM-associated protein Csm2 small subunit